MPKLLQIFHCSQYDDDDDDDDDDEELFFWYGWPAKYV